MKILVIDDNPVHLDAAKKQLEEHDLAVVGSYDVAQALLGYKAWDDRSNKHDFDVVLCDLLMPASHQMLARDARLAGEQPVGIFLALLAAKNGARYVAVFTDSDHHSHPASACFDPFNPHTYGPAPFMVEGARVLLCNNSNWVGDDETVPPQEVWRERLDGTKYLDKVYPRIKRWDYLLKYLLNPPPFKKEESIA